MNKGRPGFMFKEIYLVRLQDNDLSPGLSITYTEIVLKVKHDTKGNNM